MDGVQKKGFPLIGVIFLLLGLSKMISGGNWLVWIILGVLFGGLGVLSWKKGAHRS